LTRFSLITVSVQRSFQNATDIGQPASICEPVDECIQQLKDDCSNIGSAFTTHGIQVKSNKSNRFH